MTRSDDVLNEAIEMLRQPVARTDGVVDSLVRVSLESRAVRFGRIHTWRQRLTRPRLVLSPLAAAGWALAVAVIAAAAVFARAPAAESRATADVVRHQFVLVAPQAHSVSLVGDFNGWSVGATPLVRRDGAWTVEVPLRRGRHVYSFVVDGDDWVLDATAPRSAEDDFGRLNSVVIVGYGGT